MLEPSDCSIMLSYSATLIVLVGPKVWRTPELRRTSDRLQAMWEDARIIAAVLANVGIRAKVQE